MAMQDDLTTLVCLFHHHDYASAALEDLRKAGIPDSAISVIGGPDDAESNFEKTELAGLGMPDKDYDHLKQGLRENGYVVSVTCGSDHVETVERVFHDHSATKIDEADKTYAPAEPLAAVAAPLMATQAAGETAIPIVQEELTVGKRNVDQGGVRVYRRVVEIPVETSVDLREEHVNVGRVAVDRPVTDADLAFKDRSIELTETAEEAVVGKTARVVEEVVVGKTASQHTETIADTVRRTEVAVEEVPAVVDPVRTTVATDKY